MEPAINHTGDPMGSDEEASNAAIPLSPADALGILDTPELHAKIGRRLGDIRREQGTSQERVARAMNMSRPHLSNVELGRSRANWERLTAMANVLKMDIKTVTQQVASEPTPEPIPFTRARPGREPSVSEAAELNEYERVLVSAFRCLTTGERFQVLSRVLDAVATRLDGNRTGS